MSNFLQRYGDFGEQESQIVTEARLEDIEKYEKLAENPYSNSIGISRSDKPDEYAFMFQNRSQSVDEDLYQIFKNCSSEEKVQGYKKSIFYRDKLSNIQHFEYQVNKNKFIVSIPIWYSVAQKSEFPPYQQVKQMIKNSLLNILEVDRNVEVEITGRETIRHIEKGKSPMAGRIVTESLSKTLSEWLKK